MKKDQKIYELSGEGIPVSADSAKSKHNGVLETIQKRRSIRKYSAGGLPEQDLQAILEAGRQAPSAGGQPYRFVVVRDPEVKEALGRACNNQAWIAPADVIIAGIASPKESPKWFAINVAIALQNIILAAASLGYGTCWIGAFDEGEVKQVLRVPEEFKVVALTPIGKAAEKPSPKSRKSLAELFSLNEFGKPFEK